MRQVLIRLGLLAMVAALVPACGGSGGGGGGVAIPDFVIPGAGGFTMSSTGGISTAAATAGGTGGPININGQSGSQMNLETGAFTVKSSFTVPAALNFSAAGLGAAPPAGFDFGANVLTAATGTLNPPASGLGNVPGNNPAADATGLYVPPGVTLTVNGNGGVVGANATLRFVNGVLNAGTIILSKSAATNNSGGLTLECGVYVNAVGSVLDAKGAVGTLAVPQGGNGNFINIIGPQLFSGGAIVNLGTIDISGGDTAQASNGGNGGFGVFLSGSVAVYNTGTINNNGGNATGATSTFGGNSQAAGFGNTIIATNGFVPNQPDFGGIFISGSINCKGGTGQTNGGPGGRLFVGGGFAATTGQILMSGTINTSGGNAGVGGGTGGAGSLIWVVNSGQPIVSSATLTANGGNGAGGGAGQNGGAGGTILIESDNALGAGYSTNSAIDKGGVAVSGNMSTNGGNGAAAGNGGPITIQKTNQNAPPGLNPINVVGYSSIINSGGAGTIGGGSGNMAVRNSVHTDAQGNFTVGGVHNSIPITEVGGAGSAGVGGLGGFLNIGTNLVGGYLWINAAPLVQINGNNTTRQVVNEAAINLSGGVGSTDGGNGGIFIIQDYFNTSNTGAVTAPGGNGGAAAGNTGGIGGFVGVYSDNLSTNSGALTLNGGSAATGGPANSVQIHANKDLGLNATLTSNAHNTSTGTVILSGGTGSAGNGGNAGTLFVAGNNTILNDGACTANGGSGAGAGSNGGNGGAINVSITAANYTAGASATNTGALTANGGNGAAAGGSGGQLRVAGHATGTNSGNATANGGTGGTGNGASGGSVVVSADATVTDSGTYTMNGGAGVNGGPGGRLGVFGELASHKSGNVTANGGNGTTLGGNGGEILVNSSIGASTFHGTVSLLAGTGGTTAIIGNLWVDGIEKALAGPPPGTGTY